jgi:hypothetical protein
MNFARIELRGTGFICQRRGNQSCAVSATEDQRVRFNAITLGTPFQCGALTSWWRLDR